MQDRKEIHLTATQLLPQHRIFGEGDTTVFMLHGAYGDGRYFGNTSDYLTDAGFRVVVWDAPGYAGTAAPYGTGILNHARAAADLIAEVGSRTNVVLGHSMGGMIAPAVAGLVPELIAGVVLSASSAGLQTRTPQQRELFVQERVTPITQGKTIGEYAPALLRTMMGPGASGPLVNRVIEVVCEMPTELFLASMDAIMEYDGTQALRSLTVPTLLIAGEHDTACPPDDMRGMADLVKDSEFTILPGTGHYPFAEDPQAYHQVLLAFLATHFR